MKRLTSLTIPPDCQNTVAAIGNFDGVHLGHRAVLEQARAIAQKHNAPLAVITFEPHPRSFFTSPKQAQPFRLMNAAARASRLQKMGIDILYELPFNADLAALSADDFTRDILAKTLKIKHVLVGQDFCYGQGRKGNAQTLIKQGKALGFGVTIAQLESMAGMIISSSNIRRALRDCAPRRAAQMLGHWHRIENKVIKGAQRGRDLGYPTANISIDGLHPPAFGIYAVLVDVLTGPYRGAYLGASSIGIKPTFGENTPNCETFIFDFNADIYGEMLSVGLVEYLRGEEKFDDLNALIQQMQTDCTRAKQILENL